MVSIFSSRRTSLTCANHYTRNNMVSELKRLRYVINRLLKCYSPGAFALWSCRIDNRLVFFPIHPDRNSEIHHSECRSDFIRHGTKFLFKVCSVSGNVSFIDAFIANNSAPHELVIPPFTCCNSLHFLTLCLFDGSVPFHGLPTKKAPDVGGIRGNHTENGGLDISYSRTKQC